MVHKVKFDPYTLSDWKIGYNNGDGFWAAELQDLTDEGIGEIVAQVSMDDDEIEIPTEHKKSYIDNQNSNWYL